MTFANSGKTIELRQLLADAQLPALPQSAMQLLELSRNPDNGPAEFAVPIEADPGLAVQVLRFVNSSYFGFSREICSVKLAITLVGIRTIKNFALWSAVFSLMPNPRCGPFELKCLWQDSVRRALFARTFAKLLGLKEAEDVFAAALLQDMAIPLLAKELPDHYAELLDEREGGKRRLSDLERERFGWTHAEAACEMAGRWNLPAEFSNMVANHMVTDPMQGQPGGSIGQLAVKLSSLLPATCDECWYEAAAFEQAYYDLLPGGPTIVEMLEQIDTEFLDFATVLKMAANAKPLVETYAEAIATEQAS